jgi:flagellar basal-body rod modification protein FlgD
MTVTSATSADRTSALTGATPIANKKTSLNSNDFMKLLSVQFQHQDPMKPMEDTAFISQMAQFSSLEQSNSLVQQMAQLSARQDITEANSYLGRQVTLDDGKGGTASGLVDGVDLSSGTPRLKVGQSTYPLSSVLYVEPGAFTNPTALPPAA